MPAHSSIETQASRRDPGKLRMIKLPNIYNLAEAINNYDMTDGTNFVKPSFGDMTLSRYVSQVHGIRGMGKQNRSFLEVLEEKAHNQPFQIHPPTIHIKLPEK
jgi:hypothetical protein